MDKLIESGVKRALNSVGLHLTSMKKVELKCFHNKVNNLLTLESNVDQKLDKGKHLSPYNSKEIDLPELVFNFESSEDQLSFLKLNL